MKKISVLLISLFPSFTFAVEQTKDINSLALKLEGIGNIVIYLLVALAVIFVVWNVVMALVKSGDATAKKEALANIGYGLLGLAIIVSIWGLVNIIINTFNTDNTRPTFPKANFN